MKQLVCAGRPSVPQLGQRQKVRFWRTSGQPGRSSGKTVWHLRRGKEFPTDTVYGAGVDWGCGPAAEVILEGSLQRWRTPITRAKVAKAVRRLICRKALGVNEIRPEHLKFLDLQGLSW